MKLLSLNLGRPEAVDVPEESKSVTGIDKRPVEGPVRVFAPGPKGVGASGVAGDAVCNTEHHGGDDQAVYVFAREDLDGWERELGRTLPSGSFGENLTTEGLDVSGALIGERWRIGSEVILEITSGRIPCLNFQRHMGERGWVKRFTRQGEPGAYLRVIQPGEIRAGDPIEIVHRPEHGITVAFTFRAMMTEHELLPRLLAAGEALHPELLVTARKYVEKKEKAEKTRRAGEGEAAAGGSPEVPGS